MHMQYTMNGDGGDETEEVMLPSRYEVCGRCDGKGVHDCWEGGMTGDEMAEQGPDFREDYLNGMYDKRCNECNGQRVVQVIDRDACSKELLARYDASEAQIHAWNMELSSGY